MKKNTSEYIQLLEYELTKSKETVIKLQQIIRELKSQSSAAQILLNDLDPGNII